MDALGFFLECHENVHFRVENELLKLTETQMQTRPHPAVNPVAWVVWHMARCEDMAMNRFVGDRPQVLEEGKWLQRLGLSQRDIGTGMSDQEVDDFSSRVNIPALCDYYQAIGPRTRDIVSQLRLKAWTNLSTPPESDGYCTTKG